MANVIFQAYDLPTFDSITGTQIIAKTEDGQMGYVQASQLQTTLDGNGLATDADIANLQSQIGVSGSYSTQDKFFATNNGGGQNFKVGDDVWIGDVNTSNTMQVSGVQSSGSGYIKFGSGSTTPTLGYGGSNYHLSLSGSLQLNNQATLGTAPAGTLAVSGSSLYFYNGTAWKAVTLAP
jgi:hypothetical protein